jgi:hypothetical protein
VDPRASRPPFDLPLCLLNISPAEEFGTAVRRIICFRKNSIRILLKFMAILIILFETNGGIVAYHEIDH